MFHLLKVDTDTDQSTLTTGRAHYGQLITILFYETNSLANVVPFIQFFKQKFYYYSRYLLKTKQKTNKHKNKKKTNTKTLDPLKSWKQSNMFWCVDMLHSAFSSFWHFSFVNINVIDRLLRYSVT